MKISIPFTMVALSMAVCFSAVGVGAAAATGDADAKKLIRTAMDKHYMAGDFDLAAKKLNQADSICQTKGCAPNLRAEIFGSLAVVHWVGTEDFAAAHQDLRAMVKYDPKYQLDDTYAPPELLQAVDTAKADAKRASSDAGAAPAAPVAAAPQKSAGGVAPAAVAPPPAAPAAVASTSAVTADAHKQEEFRKQVEARKAQLAHDADESRKTAEADEAKRVAEEKKADEAKKAAEVERAARAEREAEKKAAEDKKAEEQRKIEEAKKAVEEKKEAARKAIEEKKKAAEEAKEAARKAIEEKKEAARKAIEEKKEAARKAVEEKKEAARKAAEDAAKKAEEERLAKEEQRLRTPPPVGKLQETPVHEQTKGYPIPIYVKLPAPPVRIEKPRIDVVKVVTEYSSPDMPLPKQLELKALPNGGYGGLLPCEVSMSEGDVTYFTTALNKYDNPVAGGATRAKPNKVRVKPVFTGSFPHLPGEMPPRVCKEDRGGSEAQAKSAAGAACQTNSDCPEGGACTKEGCAVAPAAPAPAVPVTKKSGGCAGCRLGPRETGSVGSTFLAIAAIGAGIVRRRRGACDTRDAA